MDLSLADGVLFAVAGIATGIINTLAGSGSLVTLPIFVFVCGLPAPVANGTNRIGVMLQSITAIGAYRQSGRLQLEGAAWPVGSALAGALLGSRIAVGIDAATMEVVLGGLMLFMLVVLLVKPSRWIHEMPVDLVRNKSLLSIVVFFLIGVYGGFIQAGVGIFLLAALVLLSRYTLASGNAIKLMVVAVYSIPTLIIFFMNGQVHIGYGLLMALFQSIGAWLGVHYIVRLPNADTWIHRLLIVMVAAAAIKFLI